jgi:hypothetical protein
VHIAPSGLALLFVVAVVLVVVVVGVVNRKSERPHFRR